MARLKSLENFRWGRRGKKKSRIFSYLKDGVSILTYKMAQLDVEVLPSDGDAVVGPPCFAGAVVVILVIGGVAEPVLG